MAVETFYYDNKIVRNFGFATLFWGIIGMLVGVTIAIQIYYPAFNFNLPWTTFGRLRPLHTNAVVFAFAGNAIFTGVYYSLMRLTKARMFSDTLSKIHFWGWQLIIVLAAVTFVFGITTSKEYAELEWPIDILITIVWVVFAINMFGTIAFVRDGVFFGSISKGTLYFKTDETSLKQYEKYNMTPFSTRGISMDYFEVPQEILTNDKLFQEWAEIALNAAIKKKKS